MNDATLRAKIKQHFSNNYQRHVFDLSMGEVNVGTTSAKALCNFLAQGLTLFAFDDPGYMHQLVEVHDRVRLMCEDPKMQGTPAYFFGLMAGTMIEMAAEAIREIDK